MTFETLYRDVTQQRIVYTSTLSTETDLMTVSLTTVEFAAGEDGGTRLVLTERVRTWTATSSLPGGRRAPRASSTPSPPS